MAEWQAALRARAKDAGLAGGNVEWRERQGDLPAIVLTTVADSHPQTLKGFFGNRPATVQVDCWGRTRAEVAALSKAAIAALAPGGEFSGVTFGRAVFDPVRDLGEATDHGFVHRDSFDMTFWHS